MRPLDPRLLRYARSVRPHIALAVALGTLTALLVIAQALLVSAAVSPVIAGRSGPSGAVWPLVGVAAVAAARAGVVWLREATGHRAAARAIRQLRARVLDAALELGPRWRATRSSQTTTLLTRGLDDLVPYFVKFLPQLFLVVTVTPAALATMLVLDAWSALIAVVVVPLIPVFMVLIGRFTQSASRDKLESMKRLGAQLLDLMAGLPTLRGLGRQDSPREHLRRLGASNTEATMGTLRVAFLSGAVLEFLTTLSVALVAVEVGMRLVYGGIDLFRGLAVIMLAPEVFEPLRQVGAQFHASANGVAAAEAAFAVIEAQPPRPRGTRAAPPAGAHPIRFEGVSVEARGVWAPASLTATIEPGAVTALVGPSGAGKSTAVACLLAELAPARGRIVVDAPGGPVDLADADPASWWDSIAWVPQSPALVPGTLLENAGGAVPSARLERAAAATGFAPVVEAAPRGWDTPIGDGGAGLSVGQRQRLALTRALAGDARLVVLDEPTAHLDAVSEEVVVRAITALRDEGRTVVVIAHRAAVTAVADRVIEVGSQPIGATADQEAPA